MQRNTRSETTAASIDIKEGTVGGVVMGNTLKLPIITRTSDHELLGTGHLDMVGLRHALPLGCRWDVADETLEARLESSHA